MDEDSQPLFELPTVRLPPFGALAAAARACEQLQLVRRLAKWTANRRITKIGNLLLPDARAAIRELNLPDHPTARAASGFPELHQLWSSALAIDLLKAEAGQAEYLAADDSDSAIVENWIALLATTVKSSGGNQQTLMPLLMRLYVDTRGITVKDLAHHAFTAPDSPHGEPQLGVRTHGEPQPGGAPAGESRPGAAPEPSLQKLVGAVELSLRDLLGALAAIDALVVTDDLALLTDLGRFGLVHWFESAGVGAPFVMDLSDATVAQVLDLALTQDSVFEEWFATVGPEIAAERILDHARGGTPTHRVVAFGMLNQVGANAADGVRACLNDRDLRPHANAWLSARGLPSGDSSLDDLHRVFIDMVAADLEGDPRSIRDSIRELANDIEYDAAALFENLWRCDHPDTLPVLEALATHYPDPAAAKAARRGVMLLENRAPNTGA